LGQVGEFHRPGHATHKHANNHPKPNCDTDEYCLANINANAHVYALANEYALIVT